MLSEDGSDGMMHMSPAASVVCLKAAVFQLQMAALHIRHSWIHWDSPAC